MGHEFFHSPHRADGMASGASGSIYIFNSLLVARPHNSFLRNRAHIVGRSSHVRFPPPHPLFAFVCCHSPHDQPPPPGVCAPGKHSDVGSDTRAFRWHSVASLAIVPEAVVRRLIRAGSGGRSRRTFQSSDACSSEVSLEQLRPYSNLLQGTLLLKR